MQNKPLVSIITATYNSSTFIEECILSVKNQTYENIEHIIIDGVSTDNTLEIIRRYEKTYNLKWISQKDNGLYDAMNKGFKIANGEIFSWLDSDNFYRKEIVQEVVSNINEKNLEVIYGNVGIMKDGKKLKDYLVRQEININDALRYNTAAIPLQPGVFFKSEIFYNAGGFNSKYKIASDYDFWLKVLKQKPNIYFLNTIFGYYRIENNGVSQSMNGTIRGLKEMLEIGKQHGQSVFGKIHTIKKYLLGIISIYIKNFKKNAK